MLKIIIRMDEKKPVKANKFAKYVLVTIVFEKYWICNYLVLLSKSILTIIYTRAIKDLASVIELMNNAIAGQS